MKKWLKTRFLPVLGAVVLLISTLVIPISASETHYYYDDADEAWYEASDGDTFDSTGYCPSCSCKLSGDNMSLFHSNCPACGADIIYNEGTVTLKTFVLKNVAMTPVAYTGVDGAAVNVYGSLFDKIDYGTVLIAVVNGAEYARYTLTEEDFYPGACFDVGTDLHYGQDFDAQGTTGWYWTGDNSAQVSVYYETAGSGGSSGAPTGAKIYFFRNVDVTAATCSMMSPVPVSGITYYVEYNGETYGSQVYTGNSIYWTVDCDPYGSVCLTYDIADGWYHDYPDTEITFSVYYYSGSADGSVNWVTCNHCKFRYDGDVFDACPYAVCDLNEVATSICHGCNREYFSTFSKCPYYDCVYNETVTETVTWAYCSTCYKRYEADVFSACPYVACKLNYVEQVSWTVCSVCDKRYESSYGSCPYASCSTNTVTHSTCSTCHREYFSTFTSCPYADCDSNAVKWNTCTVCQRRYDSDAFTDCPYADCDTNDANEVVWVMCGVCNNRYEEVFAECPYDDCETNAEDPVLPEMYECQTCHLHYLADSFFACPYAVCATNQIQWKTCDTCHKRYEPTYSRCPYADCDTNKVFSELRGSSVALATATVTFEFRYGVGLASLFSFEVSCSSIINTSGVVSFARVKEALLAAAAADGISEEALMAGLCDVTIEWDSDYYWDFNTSKFYVTAPAYVQTVMVNSGSYTYSAELDGPVDGPRLVTFQDGISRSVTSVCISYVEPLASMFEGAISFFSADYNNGYNKGYDDAVEKLESTFESGLETFYNQGYRAGVQDGFDDGYLEGKLWGAQIAEQGSFRELLTAVVDAPVKAFSSMFNFEILGQNMQQLIGALLMFCVVIFVLRKVLK